MSFQINHGAALAKEVANSVAAQTESLLAEQLGELVKLGLLVIERTEPVLVRSHDSAKIEIRQSVKLKLRDQELIEELKNERDAALKELAELQFIIRRCFTGAMPL